jgi:hypothetical protein
MKPNDGRVPSYYVVCEYNKLLSSIFTSTSIYTNIYFMYVCVNISISDSIFVLIILVIND